MDLPGRFSRWLDSFRNVQDGQEGNDLTDRGDPVKLTLYGRHFKLQLEIAGSEEVSDSGRTPAIDENPVKVPAQTEIIHPDPEGPQAPTVSFWDVLEPTEREALRAVALLRTFAGGAMLMEEGERADHVMVILGGRVKICVDEGGRERVLAVRGLGQLVGERGALEVSVRSATVVALDMIWALVVQTKDFATFLTVHPRVLDIVQAQLDQCHTDNPKEYRQDYALGTAPNGASDRTTAGRPGQVTIAGHPRRRTQPLNGENCTVLLTDVSGFGARMRTDGDRLLIREVLFKMTQAVVQGIPDAHTEDRGDGFLTVVPPDISTAKVIDRLIKEFLPALELHNSTKHESARFKLRLAVNVGPVVTDMGVSGEAIIVVARLVEAPPFKEAIATSSASLGIIASPFVYETVIRHGADPHDVASYSEVPVEVKESDTTAWMRLFESAAQFPLIHHHPAGPESYVGP